MIKLHELGKLAENSL